MAMSGSDCAICGSIADGVHYGVTSCRSCNAFFRRAVTFKHKYICRKSGHCEVNKHVRCACRACRFKKCLDTGMDRKAVQPPRDPTGSQNKRKRTATVHTPTADKPVTNIGIASTLPATTDISEMESCLDRLAQSYKDQMRMQQLHFTSVEHFLSENEKGVIFRQGKFEDMYAMSKVELPALMFWLEKLHPFKQLPMEDRVKLMNRYAMRKLGVDSIYFTSKYNEKDKYLMLNNTYFERGMSGFEAPGDDEATIKTKQSLFSPTYERFYESVLGPMCNMAITVHEITTIQVLLMWSSNQKQEITVSTKQVMQQRRSKIIQELFEHYEKIKLPDPEVRLGNVLLILPEMETLMDKHCEDFRVAKLFNLCDLGDNIWYEKYGYG